MSTLLEDNRSFYEPLWQRSRLTRPERFNTWPLVSRLLRTSEHEAPKSRLEVAPGLSPRLPLEGTHFVDMSQAAVAKLRRHGADASVGLVTRLPFGDASMDLVAAFDIVEHVENDDEALAELSRVARSDATLLLSAPLHASRWTPFDALVGHGRRYRPGDLLQKLAGHKWRVVESAPFGLQPASRRLLDFVVWSFRHRPEQARWWYSRVVLPLGAFFQKRLALSEGMVDADDVSEVLLVCRRAG
ncbi:MAG TPA: methyltransferase domain-containing protein [Polyangiaceae bacterium]|jgi:SAM-dependent methyltransferase|nr:methyltransferase domain-containing protein [Polyangiaceae bacterium]